MKTRITTAILLLVPALSLAQVPVDDDGNVIGKYESQSNITPIVDDGVPRLSYAELQDLVGPIALYPDDLLAIVLPASAYPLQVVEASRFLKALEIDPTLQPDANWDDSIVALINYPEVVALLNEDLDWTLRLGEAVVAQQTDVVTAIEGFRDRAYAAGNLKSDGYQTVSSDDGVISISPVAEDVIYVPYYEPARVVYVQPRPAYYYYPRAYPVYYYPYAANHHFDHGYFWGVTTAFSIGWLSDSLHVHHHSYYGHPYYGRTYWNDGWYRRPSISVYNTTYINNNVSGNRHGNGDRWRASNTRREYVRREGYSRNDRRVDNRSTNRVTNRVTNRSTNQIVRDDGASGAINFRERDTRTTRTSGASPKEGRLRNTTERSQIQFARRNDDNARTDTRRRQEPATRTQVQTSRRQEPTTRTQVQTSRRQEPATRTRTQTSRRQEPTTRTQVQTARRQEPAARSRPAPRPTQQRAPVRQQPRQTASPPRAEPQRSAPPQRQAKKSSGSNSRKSESRSTDRRSRER
jgi:hypothetical protein